MLVSMSGVLISRNGQYEWYSMERTQQVIRMSMT